ncbi:hypothetical protein WwAna0406 [Wolbachia endosymbiont of Drosophila ananassae]|nr:hypothetical protein WwAna0406 [Wolbachia endosymbiont of Drosophila ananassae]
MLAHPKESGKAIGYRRITGGRSNVRTNGCNGCSNLHLVHFIPSSLKVVRRRW